MPIHFCPECQNLIAFGIKDNELQIQCRTCGFETQYNETVLVTKTYRRDDNIRFGSIPAEIIYDNTLKRTIHYTCPNDNCETHKFPEQKEAVLYRESDINLKRITICAVCHTKWN